MGVAEVIGFVRRALQGIEVDEVEIDPGDGALETATHFGPPGDDAQPLDGDHAAVVEGSGEQLVVGYLDPVNARITGPGERRIYSRRADGEVVASVLLESDGTVTVESIEGSVVVVIGADGIVRLGSAGASKGVARVGDSVRVTIPTGTDLVDPETGTTLNPIVIDGEITGSSGTVTAED
jgi:hypothetical protein